MIFPIRLLAAVCFSVLGVTSLLADDVTPPIVNKPLRDITVAMNSGDTTITLKKTFALSGSDGTIVRFSTVLGDIDVNLFSTAAPLTVANFLNYVNRQAYAQSFIHRSVPGFIIQGGGYTFIDNELGTIPTDPPVKNEFGASSTRGTIAMAKLANDPDSATDEWFFNLADNSATLDPQNGGFTVFGSIIGNGLSVIDAIAALPIQKFSSPFNELPVLPAYAGGTIQQDDLVLVNSVAIVPLVPKAPGKPSVLKLNIKKNTNPGLVTAKIVGRRLILSYAHDKTGMARIVVRARDASNGAVKASFNVTVQ